MLLNISVVIPVYNRPDLLNRALCSVSKQTTKPDEVLVVDDGSSSPPDLSGSQENLDVNCLRSDKNLGVSAARNWGIQQARGEWIALLDSDDVWEPKKLERQVQYIDQNPQLLAVHTLEKWIRLGNEVIPPAYLDKSSNRLWERSLKNCLICPSSVLLHRSVFESVGWFDESLPVCEDYDFWLRLLLNHPIGLTEEKLVRKHGGHSDQLSTTTWGMDRFRIKALEKILKRSDLSDQQRKQTLDVIIEKCLVLEQGSIKREKYEAAQKYGDLKNNYSELRAKLTCRS
jgi:glycosyltransferase involved in cell wall biosynthesis